MKNRAAVLITLVIVAVATRLIPHIPNFTAVGAVALFSGAMFKRKELAFLVPILAVFLSDLLINNLIFSRYYSGFQWLTPGWAGLYSSFIITVLLGTRVNSGKVLSIASGSLISAVVFFIITNFGAWIASPLYSKDVTGLMTSYTAGIPFFANQVLGNLFYGAALFGTAWVLFSRKDLKAVSVKS